MLAMLVAPTYIYLYKSVFCSSMSFSLSHLRRLRSAWIVDITSLIDFLTCTMSVTPFIVSMLHLF
jgi:hypothetical protein